MMCEVSPCAIFVLSSMPPAVISALSLHDALPIFRPELPLGSAPVALARVGPDLLAACAGNNAVSVIPSSEEHTSVLQSPDHLVCRLLLEKKKSSPRRGSRSTIS